MGTPIHERIRRARISRGLTLEALAQELGDITKQGLSKFEKGLAVPSSTRLLQLSKALGVKPEYFFRSNTVSLAPLEFRKLSRMPAYRQEQVQEMMRDHLERYLSLEKSFDENLSIKLTPARSVAVNSIDDAESAATWLRKKWGVGNDAIADLIDLLENQGFKVVLLNGIDNFDGACAATVDERNVLFGLNGDRPGERMRFTAAHELGHWIMKLPQHMPEKDKERCCHRFAAAFLFPAGQVKLEFGVHQRSKVHPQELFNAKKTYGVSMAMISLRLKDLGLLSDAGYRSLLIQFGQQGWRKSEPGALPSERPRRFESLTFRGLSEDIFTISRAAELLQIPISRLTDRVLGALLHE
ncbi:helix-turn-helix domain-containing protein [Duganella radicis]|uniref:Helix-turn-helix domain-containing protein n=1 Tax=Duganella radicis TaxID=551988 RepID=A0A6L6PE85_9BURK|nr:XRE family transcriptional regulator [Duganella radicis]MTV37029.1 helix-turn-helix domain-containing protein [Duganella radicis]